MLKEQGPGRNQAAREVGRALQVFARTARARHLYRSNNVTLKRMMSELTTTFRELLGQLGELSLKFRPESIIWEDEIVFEDPNPEESIAFAFYRDGIRRLDLTDGLDDSELDVLLSATATGFQHSGLGDDIVSVLWRHDLEHVRYMVVDTIIVDAEGTSGEPSEVWDLDVQIDALLMAIYGSTSADDVGPRSIRVDASDLSAKGIAETLDTIDDMAPGFHPARLLIEPPAYAAELTKELEAEDDRRVSLRAVREALHAMRMGIAPDELDAVAEALLRMYDAALMSMSYDLASEMIRGMRELATLPLFAERAQEWVNEAVAEARLRQVWPTSPGADDDSSHDVSDFLEACGPRAVPAILAFIPAVQDPTRRRALSTLVARIGVENLEPVRALLNNEQVYVAVEAIHMLAMLDTPSAQELLISAKDHAQAPVRAALLSVAARFPNALQLMLAIDLIDDPETEVKVTAARVLSTIKDIRAVRAIEMHVKKAELLEAPFPVKSALLTAYAALAQMRALPVLAKMFHDGGGLLAKKDAEDLAIAAAMALASLGTPGAVSALKKAGRFLNMRVREAAQQALRRTKVVRA